MFVCYLPERDDSHVVPEPKGRGPVERWLHVDDRLHLVLVGSQDGAELGQQLVAGDHQLSPGLVQAVDDRLLTEVGVQRDHRETLPEAGLHNRFWSMDNKHFHIDYVEELHLGSHHPLHPGVSEQADTLSRLLPEGSKPATKPLGHRVDLVVAEPTVVAQVQLGEHLPVWLHLAFKDVGGSYRSWRISRWTPRPLPQAPRGFPSSSCCCTFNREG